MKCPQCGNEVVIATDLCPWCGYKYAFDGSIMSTGGPASDDDSAVRYSSGGGSAQSMRWYNFVVNALLPLTALVYFGAALSDLGALYTDIVYYGGIVVFAPLLLVIRFATLVLLCIFGVLALIARRQLRSHYLGGVKLYLSVILVPVAFPVLCDLIMLAYLGWYGEMPEHVAALAAAAVYAALTNVYFRKRVYMFE